MDIYDIAWEYEPVEFALRWDEGGSPRAGFRPDFWLPAQSCFVELTTADQRLVTRKNAKVRRMRQLYPEIELVVVYQRDFLALLERHGLDPAAVNAA
jgi:hypoxanthine phosphoribosyltransferase